MQEPQQGGLATPPNMGPMLPGGMPFGGMPGAANAANNRLGAQQFAGMGGAFPMNRAAINANMGVLRGNAACGSNGFGGMGASMRTNAPGQGGMPMGNPFMCGMMGASGGMQGGYSQNNDLLAMINKGGMGMGPGGLGDLGGADVAGGPQFDMSDFPALANRVAMTLQQQPPPPPGMHRAAVTALQQQEPEFAIQSEDFPALPGVASAAKGPQMFGQPGGLGGLQQQGLQGMSMGGDTRHLRQHMQSPMEHVHALAAQHAQAAQLKARGGGFGGSGGGCESASFADPWSLLGLLNVIRVTDADLNYLALGTDLTSLGLNLNSPECLYGTFASPWADGPVRSDPEYCLPQCYYMQPPALKTSHFGKFQLETLFYIFYNMPRDTLQAYAATELYNREWRYHKDLKLWFTRSNAQPGTDDGKGQYVFFDINAWEKKMFQGSHTAGGAGSSSGDGDAELSVGMDDSSALLSHS